DKEVLCTVDGLNQMFEITKLSPRKTVINKIGNEDLGSEILIKVNVNKEVQHIMELDRVQNWQFKDAVQEFSRAVLNNTRLEVDTSGECKNCEFRVTKDDRLKDGFRECWQKKNGFTASDFEKPMIWELWRLPTKKVNEFINSKKYFLTDLTRNDLEGIYSKSGEAGVMTPIDRQEAQLKSVKESEKVPHVLKDALYSTISNWQFPLHFIDFEGTRTALPFFKGMKPYEQVVFQFSHHLVQENGFIEHKTEWLNVDRGSFPNFDFVRALKKALEGDEGTIFMYSSYENTVLNSVRDQLLTSSETDQMELVKFIEHITKRKGEKKLEIIGDRCMVDLLEVIKNFYYHPIARGSNSIKKILPAILESNVQLQSQYARPIYGTSEFPSKNFTNQVWVKYGKDNKPLDPYQLLEPIFENYTEEGLEEIFEFVNAQSHFGIT